jgi:hypothetical protein
VGLHAHQRYLDRHGTPSTVADLATHSLIGFYETTEFIRNAGKALPGWRLHCYMGGAHGSPVRRVRFHELRE